MEGVARPHRGQLILAMAILSFFAAFVAIPLGLMPWIMGSRELAAMRVGRIDRSGRRATMLGWLLGIATTIQAGLVATLIKAAMS